MRTICGVLVGALVLSAPAVAAAQGVALADPPPSANTPTNFENICAAAAVLLGTMPGSCIPKPPAADY
jgi:hypothetical protein